MTGRMVKSPGGGWVVGSWLGAGDGGGVASCLCVLRMHAGCIYARMVRVWLRRRAVCSVREVTWAMTWARHSGGRAFGGVRWAGAGV